jgi:hypothetical protein
VRRITATRRQARLGGGSGARACGPERRPDARQPLPEDHTRTLGLPDATRGTFTDVVDPEKQFAAGKGAPSTRHRVRNNLPGTTAFCPLVFRTDALEAYLAEDLAARARAAVARVPADVLARAAAFLLLEDSRSSFAIEGEPPLHSRIERSGQAIGQAGQAAALDLASTASTAF